MKHKQSSGTRPVHQKVAGEFEFKASGKSIAIGFIDQRLSPYAGSATFWSWVRGGDWINTLGGVLPHVLPASNNHLLPIEKALAFMHGLFVTAGVLSYPRGKTTIKLAVPVRERAWWRRLWDKILSPLPNCHAVENRPAFTD